MMKQIDKFNIGDLVKEKHWPFSKPRFGVIIKYHPLSYKKYPIMKDEFSVHWQNGMVSKELSLNLLLVSKN